MSGREIPITGGHGSSEESIADRGQLRDVRSTYPPRKLAGGDSKQFWKINHEWVKYRAGFRSQPS